MILKEQYYLSNGLSFLHTHLYVYEFTMIFLYVLLADVGLRLRITCIMNMSFTLFAEVT